MLKIATHDSATGERGWGILSWITAPFAMTQSKTIQQQYNAGCRQFDIRVRKTKRGWICAHGTWQTKRSALDILEQISKFEDQCQVVITYEGTLQKKDEFVEFINLIKATYTNIIWGQFCTKYAEKVDLTAKVSYIQIAPCSPGFSGGTQGFLPLDGRSWHTYLPIPWLWDRIYKRPHVFNEATYTYVDFL